MPFSAIVVSPANHGRHIGILSPSRDASVVVAAVGVITLLVSDQGQN